MPTKLKSDCASEPFPAAPTFHRAVITFKGFGKKWATVFCSQWDGNRRARLPIRKIPRWVRRECGTVIIGMVAIESHRFLLRSFEPGTQWSKKKVDAVLRASKRLVRRFRNSQRLDFEPAVRCHCGQDNLTVIDHRAPWYEPTASKEWRYEVTCNTCLQCDAKGYANCADVLAAYSANACERLSEATTNKEGQ